jgi:hypothetical protein
MRNQLYRFIRHSRRAESLCLWNLTRFKHDVYHLLILIHVVRGVDIGLLLRVNRRVGPCVAVSYLCLFLRQLLGVNTGRDNPDLIRYLARRLVSLSVVPDSRGQILGLNILALDYHVQVVFRISHMLLDHRGHRYGHTTFFNIPRRLGKCLFMEPSQRQKLGNLTWVGLVFPILGLDLDHGFVSPTGWFDHELGVEGFRFKNFLSILFRHSRINRKRPLLHWRVHKEFVRIWYLPRRFICLIWTRIYVQVLLVDRWISSNALLISLTRGALIFVRMRGLEDFNLRGVPLIV